ncbi:MAG: SDR family oxidoreductase [Bifidobacterium sp.]|nr:SDR family oxidoreductase [Bifidobacterium sp.]MCI1865650.1 SDR family oxidoreductase [Bifidobacterium sp.]
MAGTYVVTGSASGMGRAIVTRLQSEGKRVITVDLHDADVVADLSTVQGRTEASRKVLVLSGGLLEGAVMAAGLGPRPGKEFVRLIAQVNYFGVVELLNAWHDALAAGKAKVVVIGSNSTTATPLVPRTAVRAFLHGDARTAIGAVRIFGKAAPSMIYAASKIAVTRWVRRSATAARWVDEGIRMNVLAPGAIMTPLLEKQLSTPEERRNIEAFPLPVRHYGTAEGIAAWVTMMLSHEADFMCGSVVFVDGGSDAYLRPDAWPKQVPGIQLLGYMRKMKAWGERGKLR